MSISTMLSGHKLDAVLDSIVEQSWNSVMVTKADAGTPIVYVNSAFTELTGYTPSDVMGRSPSLLQGADTDARVIDRLREDLAAGRVFEGQTVNYRKDGTGFIMVWRVIPVRDANGTIIYFVALQQGARA